MSADLILGSVSKRRSKLLSEMGLQFEVLPPDVDEVFYEYDPYRTVEENAFLKHRWCRDRRPEAALITADTVIDFDNKCVAKPSSLVEARSFLKMFATHHQDILTAVVFSCGDAVPKVETVISTVMFKPLDDAVIDEYFSYVDPLDKAGAYDINQHGEMIIKSVEGSYSNIMGFPQETVTPWLREAGFIQ